MSEFLRGDAIMQAPEIPLTADPCLPTGNPLSQPGEPFWEAAYFFPPQGAFSEAEYLSMGTNHLIEFDQGRIEVLPMPTPLHQVLVQFLCRLLEDFAKPRKLGLVFTAPSPVRLTAEKYREPDIVLVKPGRLKDLTQPPNGADLVIEVLSPGETNRRRDLVAKRHDYAAAQIPEYWIVDPDDRAVTVLVLEGEQVTEYAEHGVYREGDTALSRLLPGFSVDVKALFAEIDMDSTGAG